MRSKIFTALTLACGFLICIIIPGDISGKWMGTVKTPNGDYPLGYNFTASGNTLNGTAFTPQGVMPITNGKVDGSNFTFTVDVGGVSVKNICKYYPDGDTVSVNLDYNGYKMHATITRDVRK